ncbi:hypothetical protein L9F63_013990, partial [Diploptera punctata]
KKGGCSYLSICPSTETRQSIDHKMWIWHNEYSTNTPEEGAEIGIQGPQHKTQQSGKKKKGGGFHTSHSTFKGIH